MKRASIGPETGRMRGVHSVQNLDSSLDIPGHRPGNTPSQPSQTGQEQRAAHAAQIAPRRDGADLLHHPELDHPKPSAKRTKPSRLPMGSLNARRPHGPELGHLQIRRPLKLRSWVNAAAAHPQTGAQKILVANGRSVTQALTAGKPVDRIHLNDISTEVRFPHIGAGKFACAAGKAGNPALLDLLNLRECSPIAQNPSFVRTFPQSVEKPGSKQKASDVARNLVYLPSRERDARGPRQDARDALRAANELTHLLPWRHR